MNMCEVGPTFDLGIKNFFDDIKFDEVWDDEVGESLTQFMHTSNALINLYDDAELIAAVAVDNNSRFLDATSARDNCYHKRH